MQKITCAVGRSNWLLRVGWAEQLPLAWVGGCDAAFQLVQGRRAVKTAGVLSGKRIGIKFLTWQVASDCPLESLLQSLCLHPSSLPSPVSTTRGTRKANGVLHHSVSRGQTVFEGVRGRLRIQFVVHLQQQSGGSP